MKRAIVVLAAVYVASGLSRAPSAQTPTARAAAPIDMTGTWVSLVTDDWRWRMVTPPKGDILYLPVNAEGRKVAEAWDAARDEAANEQCKGYGAPGVMALPGRLRISWQDDQTLKMETDTGQQTRIFSFRPGTPAAGERTLQGRSLAQWELEGRHHQPEAGLLPQERRPLRRERRLHRVLRARHRARRQPVPERHLVPRGPAVPDRSVHPDRPLQEGTERREVGADGVFRAVIVNYEL
jgi:hypothetical protein